jgi:shikimate dehydrogenase
MDASAAAIQSINTLVNTDGRLKAYNTDYIAIRQLIDRHGLNPDTTFALRGSGGMAKAVASAFRDAGFKRGTIIARNAETGPALARGCGYDWRNDLAQLRPQMLINVTPVGMSGGPQVNDLAFPREAIEATETVFDVVALPAQTPLVLLGQSLGKQVVTGLEVIAIQALEQFVLYTGVRPSDEQVRLATEFARAQ